MILGWRYAFIATVVVTKSLYWAKSQYKIIALSRSLSGNALEQAEIVNLCSFLVMTSCDDVTIKNEKYICTLRL